MNPMSSYISMRCESFHFMFFVRYKDSLLIFSILLCLFICLNIQILEGLDTGVYTGF